MRNFPVISADSHITEAPNTYVDYIDAGWKERAPRIVNTADRGDVFVIDGMDRPIALGLVAAAGKPAEEITEAGVRFEELHRGGWDPQARLAEQDQDGVAAEVIYPTVGMMLCNHADFAYKDALLRRLQPLDRRVLRDPSRTPARLRTDRGYLTGEDRRGPARHKSSRSARRDDVRQSRRRGLRFSGL